MLRGVLPLAPRIGEPQIHVFHGMLGQHLHHLAHALAGARSGFLAISEFPVLSSVAAPADRAIGCCHGRTRGVAPRDPFMTRPVYSFPPTAPEAGSVADLWPR